jgi:hypothetical protein
MAETTKLMKWDGVGFADPLNPDRTLWRNQDQLGPPAAEGFFAKVSGFFSSAWSTVSGAFASGSSLAAQRAEVVLVAVSERFAPIEEFAIIELKFKNIEGIGCLVLQIHDADGQLVYAERLTRDMVRRLPDAGQRAAIESMLPPLSARGGPMSAANRKARWQAKWAHPVGTPYSVTLWVTNQVCADSSQAGELSLDVAAEVPVPPHFIEKHKPMNPLGAAPVPPPLITTEQTSVRLTGDLKPVLLGWEEVFEHLTGEEFPDDPTGLDDTKKLLWAKCRLNQLGFSAGPIDTKADDPDFVKAVRRYAGMRAAGGVVDYALSPGGEVKKAAANPYDHLRTPPGIDALLQHLKKERELAKKIKPVSNKDQLGDGGVEPLRVYIDANRYFIEGDEKKLDIEQGALTAPCLPIRPRVPVLGRDGRTTYDIPEVLEAVFFHWTWTSPPEDLTRLIDPAAIGPDETASFAYAADPRIGQLYARPELRSRTRTYVDLAKKRVAAKAIGGHEPAYTNALVYIGGKLSHHARANRSAVFASYVKDPAAVEHRFPERSPQGLEAHWIAANVIAEPTSRAREGAVATPGGRIYFCPSLIAGDQYQLTVELFWEQQRTAHCADLSAVADRLDRLKRLNVPTGGGRFTGSTRTLEAWRRLRIDKFVHWPKATQTWDGRPLDFAAVWTAVKKEYALAYVEFQNSAAPETDTLPECLIQDLKLEARHFSNQATKTLKNGLRVEHVDIRDAVTALLPLSTPASRGRRQVTPVQFSPDHVLPRLEEKALSLAAGTLQSVADIVALVFLPALNEYHKIKTGALAGDELDRFDAAYSLVKDWDIYSTLRHDGPDAALNNELYLTSRYLGGTLDQVITRTAPRPYAWNVDGGQQVVVSRCTGFDGSGRIDLTQYPQLQTSRASYVHGEFASLIDRMFLPDVAGGVREEIINWVHGVSLAATRTLALRKLIEHVVTPLWDAAGDFRPGPNYFTAWALKRYLEYFDFILNAAKTAFDDLPTEHRNLFLCMTHPAVVETSVHNVYANVLDPIGTGKFPLFFDQIVRKGLLCETDGSDQYTAFADGIIVICNRPYPALTLEGTVYDDVAGPSLGLPLGVVLLSFRSTMEPYALLAHEMGHVLSMQHFRNASTTQASGFLFDHDHEDTNCVMSYPLVEVPKLDQLPPRGGSTYEANRLTRFTYLHIRNWQDVADTMNDGRQWAGNRTVPYFLPNFAENAPAKLTRPHFCGKCNLKLRGWNILAGIAADSQLVNPTFPAAAVAPAAAPAAPGPGAPGAVPLAPPMAGPPPPMGMAPAGGVMGMAGAAAAAPGAPGPIDWSLPVNADPITANHPDLLPVSSGQPFHRLPLVNRQFSGELPYPAPPHPYVVQPGDTLCGIAAGLEHRSCYPVLVHPQNDALRTSGLTAGMTIHVPRRRPGDVFAGPRNGAIHCIRGSNGPDADLTHLNVSNFPADKGGPDADQPFPDENVRVHDANAHADEDAFQIEAEWSAAPQAGVVTGQLKLEALKPLYAGGAVTGHGDYPPAELARRTLILDAAPWPANPNGPNRVRSAYVRLVSLEAMQALRPRQTLLVGAYLADPNVEPLDHDVRATFVLPSCARPEADRCRIEKTIPLERARKQVDLAIRVLRAAPNGAVGAPGSPADNGIVRLVDMERCVRTIVRNVFSQAHVRFNIVRLETVDVPSDMIAVANETGNSSAGAYTIAFRLEVTQFGPPVVVTPYDINLAVPAPSKTPQETAQLIAAEINRVAGPHVRAAESQNPIIGAGGNRSADVVLTCDPGYRAEIKNLVAADPQQTVIAVTVARPRPSTGGVTIPAGGVIVDNHPGRFHIGSPEMRLIFKALDSGGRVVDIVCAQELYNSHGPGGSADGFALGPFLSTPTHQPHPMVKNSVLITRNAATTAHPACNFLPHELGHLLIDTGMHVRGGQYAADPDTWKHALMWWAPGDGGLHATLNEQMPATDNWTVWQLDGGGAFDFGPGGGAAGSPGNVRVNAVANILAHEVTY